VLDSDRVAVEQILKDKGVTRTGAFLDQGRLTLRFGSKQDQLKAFATRMPDPPATLQQREIDLVVDFLIAKVVGKGPMDRAKCVEFWGSETDVCKQFPK